MIKSPDAPDEVLLALSDTPATPDVSLAPSVMCLTRPPPGPPRSKVVAKRQAKRNPLRNVHAMLRLNPYAAVVKQAALGDEKKAADLKAARAEKAKVSPGS